MAEKALGSGIKEPMEAEKELRQFARRSIFVKRGLKRGEVIDPEALALLRPCIGLEPKYFKNVIGKRAARDLKPGEPLTWGSVEE